MVHLAVSNNRAYFIGNEYDPSLFHENQNAEQAVLKGVSFRLHVGWMAKILQFFGLVAKFETNLPGEEEKQTIYVNKSSFAKYLARSYVLYTTTTSPVQPKEYIQGFLDNYPISFDSKVRDIEAFVRRYFSTYQRSREVFKDISVFFEEMLEVIRRRESFNSQKSDHQACPTYFYSLNWGRFAVKGEVFTNE